MDGVWGRDGKGKEWEGGTRSGRKRQQWQWTDGYGSNWRWQERVAMGMVVVMKRKS
ncbi:hypothetical protein HYC85_010832 [Camellia sinensis]|uniref:Uncharacterized protein n=1 Tax=Camellia sinensis TaxID=4442 RepID=A0A7J7HLM2_CAMSI|nr:hypothetical protein HYC85_010832 [Camellia sinensis]